MSLIQVKLAENVVTPAQKSEVITKLTDALASVEGENMRPVTSVTIEKVRSGEGNIGGKAVTTDTMDATFASFFGYGCM